MSPLLVVLHGRPARGGAALGFAFGVGFFGLLLSWISLVGFVALGLLVVLQAAWLALFAMSWCFLARSAGPAARVVLAASLWVLVEYGRAHWPLGGFPWGQLAQSQHDFGVVLRSAALGGAWLVALLVVAANACVAEVFRARSEPRRAWLWVGGALVLLGAPAVAPGPDETRETVRIAVVQGNVPRRFSGSVYEKEQVILRSHVRLTRNLPRDVDIVVWPESAVGIDLDRDARVRRAIAAAARASDSAIIAGGNLDLPHDRYKVMTFLFSRDGRLVDRYQKTHLVPFGEYVPWRSRLEWIPLLDQVPRDAVPGHEPVVYEIDGTRIATVISFEGDFGSLVRRRIDMGGRVLVVTTNTSTWGESWASVQHLAFSQVRAVENGVPVVHAALSGVSGFVEPDGSVTGRTRLWTATTLLRDVRIPARISLYARTGDVVPAIAALATLVAMAMTRSRRLGSVA